jgi:trans-aconitate methyltransferase
MVAQQWNPDEYERNARFVSDLGAGVVELLNPQPGERVLDLGCGDGVLTEKIVAAGCRVVGIDASQAFVSAARARGLDARMADARDLEFQAEFDAVFSNAVLHWIRDADSVLSSVHRALKPGGRFVAELGGAGCVRAVRAALDAVLAGRGVSAQALDPWFFPDADEYRGLLASHGFVVDSLVLFERPTPLPGELAGWLETFAQAFLAPFSGTARQDVIREVSDMARRELYDPRRGWVVDYVRLRFAARCQAHSAPRHSRHTTPA